MSGMEAGQGQSMHYYIGAGLKTEPLQRRAEYIGIDAVAWSVNKQGGFFKDRTASGTLQIELSGGREAYDVALGTFELQGEQRVAPVFNHPVLPDRAYKGGGIGLKAKLVGVAKDTALTHMLKSAADASLGIVKGMVDTAALVGPSAVLSAAGGSLAEGVRQTLASMKNTEPFFDPNAGIQLGVRAEQLTSERLYVLLHRGSQLNSEELTIEENQGHALPFYAGELLVDGAWLLLRIRRSTVYRGSRPWEDDEQSLRLALQNLASDVSSGLRSKENAREELTPSTDGQRIADRFLKLRTIIGNDGVLTTSEAATRVAALSALMRTTRSAIDADDLRGLDGRLTALVDETTRDRDQGPEASQLLRDFDDAWNLRVAADEERDAVSGAAEERPVNEELLRGLLRVG